MVGRTRRSGCIENSASGPDRVFAYDLLSGERQPEREFELDRRNRFSHGIWSDGEVVWIADSGQDKLFAYNLEIGRAVGGARPRTGRRQQAIRGGSGRTAQVFYVLDSRPATRSSSTTSRPASCWPSHTLDKLNKQPTWDSGPTGSRIWVSDDGAKRLFAYRARRRGAGANRGRRSSAFRSLLKAGNGDPRGIWSDGDVVYVADEQDDKVYSYNIPDATIAQLASLSLSDIDIGAFAANRHDYTASAEHDAASTTVAAQATQQAASVLIEPSDADGDPENGHQVALGTETAITITVTSADGSRSTTYSVQVSKPPCLEGLTEERLSEVRFVGGSVSELEACTRRFDVSALYHRLDAVWTALFLSPDLPDFLSQPFHNRFPDGLPPGELLIANREPT